MKIFPLGSMFFSQNFNFVGVRRISYGLSILLLILSIIFIITIKFNFGIDFIGGINIELKVNTTPDLALIREILKKLNIGEIILQNIGTKENLAIKIGNINKEFVNHNIDLIKNTLMEQLPYAVDFRKIDFVGPQIGHEIIKSSAIAILLSFFSIIIYIWIRFDLIFGVGIIISLIHDIILCLGFMSISQLDFNLSSVAAILTILGYSVNDSVVIYDRIRENLKKYSQNDIIKLINISINETLSRTIITVVTTLIANLALIIFGGAAIKSFSILVFVGIIIGTYSSIFISAPILLLLKSNKI